MSQGTRSPTPRPHLLWLVTGGGLLTLAAIAGGGLLGTVAVCGAAGIGPVRVSHEAPATARWIDAEARLERRG